MMDRRNFLRTASSFTLLTVGATTDASRTTGESIGKYLNLDHKAFENRGLSTVSRQVHKLCDRSGRNIPA